MTEPSLDAASETPAGDYQAAIAALRRMIAWLEARVERLEQPTAQWLPMKAAAHDCGPEYETVRQWVVRGLVEGRRDGGRWLVNTVSLMARKDRFAGSVSETKLTT
jgi:hypothetical protein